MINMIDQGRKIVEPVIVYCGAGLHYMLQLASLQETEVAINILVGVLVAIYTLTKIVDWIWSKRKARRQKRPPGKKRK